MRGSLPSQCARRASALQQHCAHVPRVPPCMTLRRHAVCQAAGSPGHRDLKSTKILSERRGEPFPIHPECQADRVIKAVNSLGVSEALMLM